jgi:hypothetical protein
MASPANRLYYCGMPSPPFMPWPLAAATALLDRSIIELMDLQARLV